MNGIDSIHQHIAEFLASGQTPSDGGYAPVEPAELEQLHSIIQALIAAKYQPDPDGDLPVSVRVLDHTRFEAPLQMDIPHTHSSRKLFQDVDDAELHLLVADRFQFLASHASRRAAEHLQHARRALGEAASANQPMVWSGVPYAVVPPEGVTVERVHETIERQVREAVKTRPCPGDFSGRQAWLRNQARIAQEALGVAVTPGTCTLLGNTLRLSFGVPALAGSVHLTVDLRKAAHPSA